MSRTHLAQAELSKNECKRLAHSTSTMTPAVQGLIERTEGASIGALVKDRG